MSPATRFGACAAVLLAAGAAHGQAAGWALRFYGNAVNDIDRVKIRLDAPARPVDVSGDLTVEFWMRALWSENGAPDCVAGSTNWIYGNIVVDRDVFGAGDYGDYGVSLRGGRVAFGVSVDDVATTICGASVIADGAWHHLALTRRASDGQLRIFVDGQSDGSGLGPTGNLSYRDGRATMYPNSDPFLVIGAEKHDAGSLYPAYSGWVDELRVSNVVRYTGTFTRPSAPFVPDAQTVALYHFDEGSGDVINDVSGAPGGPSQGERRYGGNPAGPVWVVSDAPVPVELQSFRLE